MTHFNFIPVNARLVPRSRVPRAAAHPPALSMSRRPARRSAPAPHLFGGHSWALLALVVVQSPSRPVRPAMAPLLGSFVGPACFVSSFSTRLLPHHLLWRFLLFHDLYANKPKKDFVGKVLSIHSAERFLDIDYPVLYTTHTHSFLPRATNNNPRLTTHAAR